MKRTEVTAEQITAAQGGDADAMWEIVQALEPMLRSIVRDVAPGARPEDVEDYLQEARASLIQHVRDYDTSATASLSSYAYRAIRRVVAEADVQTNTALTIDASAVLRVRRALHEAGGDPERAWESLNTSDDGTRCMIRPRFLAIMEALAGTESLDAPVGGDTDGYPLTLADVLPDADSLGMATSVERENYARWLMTQIPYRQSYALRAYYGVRMTAMPDAQVAGEMGISAGRLRMLRSDGCKSARRVAAGGYVVPSPRPLADAA